MANISTYSGSVSGGNWTPALDAAWNAVKGTGGEIFIDADMLLGGMTTFTNSGNQVPLAIRGDWSKRITVHNSPSAAAFNFGDKCMLSLRDLVVMGDGDTTPPIATDCVDAIVLNGCIRATVERSFFIGLKGGSVFRVQQGTQFVIRDSILSGNAAKCIWVDGAFSALIENCDFLDYFQFDDIYHSKSPDGAGWIVAENPNLEAVGANKSAIIIRNCRFDEASEKGISITDYEKVEIDQCRFNISSGGSSSGIYLENVEHAIIRQCHVGYNNVDKPHVKLVNCGNVTIIGEGKDTDESAPYRVEKDAGTTLKLLQSPGITVTVV